MNMTTTKLIRVSFAMGCALAVAAIGLRAQTTPATTTTPAPTAAAPATSSTTSSGKVTTLAKYIVSDVPIEDNVLPTVRPVGDVMGDDREHPRHPALGLERQQAWMDDRMVKNAMDFQQFSPGVYAAAQYGIPAVPYIRGDLAQIYVGWPADPLLAQLARPRASTAWRPWTSSRARARRCTARRARARAATSTSS
jgi:hypothetical protein